MSNERFRKHFIHSRTESNPIFFCELRNKTTELNECERRFDAMIDERKFDAKMITRNDFFTPRRGRQKVGRKRAESAWERNVDVSLLHRSARFSSGRARGGPTKRSPPEASHPNSPVPTSVTPNHIKQDKANVTGSEEPTKDDLVPLFFANIHDEDDNQVAFGYLSVCKMKVISNINYTISK